jgi:3-methyladenine DNA glycosylase AlkC
MTKDYTITNWFGQNLAQLLSEKILLVYPNFNSQNYIQAIKNQCEGLSYTQRIILHANQLKNYLPSSFKESAKILVSILGPENPNEIGMFTNFYLVLPIGKFVELYGLEDFKTSIKTIEEITKRNTGEYAIRPFIRKFPDETMAVMKEWSLSSNFHLRRLASEGCRPKLPWATKLDLFIQNPTLVFEILANLIDDDVRFVQKSVANNIADYLKVNPNEANKFIKKYEESDNKNTQWILKYARRALKNI